MSYHVALCSFHLASPVSSFCLLASLVDLDVCVCVSFKRNNLNIYNNIKEMKAQFTDTSHLNNIKLLEGVFPRKIIVSQKYELYM